MTTDRWALGIIVAGLIAAVAELIRRYRAQPPLPPSRKEVIARDVQEHLRKTQARLRREDPPRAS